MNRAHDAVIRAENDADAVTYAPNILIRARDALTRMENEADAKRYDAAKNFAAEAINNAERAITEGRTGAGRAREEATRLIDSLSGLLAETLSAINAAREIQGIQLDFDALMNEMDLARRAYEAARQSIQANNFLEAINQGQTVRSLLSGINTMLTGAAQVISRK
jgi:mannitol-specific phosphotransferase system IIBC component